MGLWKGGVLGWVVGILGMKWWREGMVAWFVAAGEVGVFVVESVASVCFCGFGGDEVFEASLTVSAMMERREASEFAASTRWGDGSKEACSTDFG